MKSSRRRTRDSRLRWRRCAKSPRSSPKRPSPKPSIISGRWWRAWNVRRSSWATPSAGPSPNSWSTAAWAPHVVIDSAPPEGVRVNPPSQIKSLFPVLKNPANRHRAVGFTKEQFHYTFANTISREESDAAYDLLHIPAPGNWVWAYGLIANWKPGHQETWVDYDLDERAPLLFIIGGKDHLMPPSVIRSNAKKYRNSEATTDTYEFPDRSHFTGVEPGWEQVADYALEWATSHARAPQG